MEKDAPKDKNGVEVVKEMFGKVSPLSNKEKEVVAGNSIDIPDEIFLIVRETKRFKPKRRR